MEFYAIGKAAKILGVTPQTLRVWQKEGKLIPNHISTGGHRYYSDEQLNQILHTNRRGTQITVGYCRVSSSKQKDDLERQVENVKTYLLSQGKPFEIITDIGSGINYNKPGLRNLLRRIDRNEVNRVVVLYKDRLLRFGFEMLQYMATLHGCEIEIIDSTPRTEQQELVEDLVQIVTVFSCRLQGKRAKKTKQLIRALKGEADDEND